jgi:hypothetical protein
MTLLIFLHDNHACPIFAICGKTLWYRSFWKKNLRKDTQVFFPSPQAKKYNLPAHIMM